MVYSRKKEQNPNKPEIVGQVVSSSTWTQLWTRGLLETLVVLVVCSAWAQFSTRTASSVLVNGDSLQLVWSVSGWPWWTVYLVLVLKVVATLSCSHQRGFKSSVLNSFPATLSAFSNVVSDCHLFTTGMSVSRQSNRVASSFLFKKMTNILRQCPFLGIVFPPAPKSYAVQPIR